MSSAFDGALQTLSDAGLLLLQDKHLPNVATLVTGEPLRTSWWSHPKGRLIFAVVTELAEHPDVLFTKLLQKKVTLVHRRLWRALLTVANAGESWQLDGLSDAARRLLDSVNESQEPIRAHGAAVKELESRLLAHTQQVHGETGQHEIMVQSWPAWARSAGVTPLRSTAAAKQQLEAAAKAIGAGPGALPWR